MLSRQGWLGLLLLCLPLLYQLYCPEQKRSSLVSDLARSWHGTIRKPRHGATRVAVGVNSNLDLVVSATGLLRALGVAPGQPADHTSLSSREQLQQQVAHSMLHCAGTERVFTSEEEFQLIVKAAYGLPHTSCIGGNAALMAEKIKQSQKDIEVMLAGPISTKLKELLHPDIHTPTFTPDSHEEVHLIMEYPKGEGWGHITSSCANRVITSHDVSNARMVSLEQFQGNLKSFRPDLIVLSGAHLMQGEEEAFRRERLEDIARVLDSIPRSIPIHWELATIGDLAYLLDLGEAIFPRIDSLGLNEQELVSFTKSAGADVDFTRIPPKPGIPVVSDLLHWLLQSYSPLGRNTSRLTRVHFHTLSFHIVASLQRPGRWGNSDSAVLAGARVAGLQACDEEDFTPGKFEFRVPLNFSPSSTDPKLSESIVHITPDAPVASWLRRGVVYSLSPVLVCKNPLKTVGLGDAISSLGLLYSEFSSE